MRFFIGVILVLIGTLCLILLLPEGIYEVLNAETAQIAVARSTQLLGLLMFSLFGINMVLKN